jgi:hypothetical protein
MSVFRILLVMFSTTVSLPSCPGRMIVPRPDRTFFGTEEPGTASTSTYRRALQVVKDREGNGAERARALKTWCRIGQMQKARACPGIETLSNDPMHLSNVHHTGVDRSLSGIATGSPDSSHLPSVFDVEKAARSYTSQDNSQRKGWSQDTRR